MNEIQQANPCSSLQAINSPNFQEFLSDLLKCFFGNLKGELRSDLTRITGNVKVQVKQGVDRYVSKQLIPELSTFIESKCGVAPEKQLLSLKPFIMKGLETFLHEGRILNKDEIITLARKGIPELITEMAVPNANEKNKKTVAKIVALASNAAFKNGLTPTSYSEFIKSLRDSLYNIVVTESKEQLIASMNVLIDYMYSSSFEKQNALPISKLLVTVLAPYLPNDFLQCLESTIEDTWKTKLSTKKVLQKTAVKTIDRVTSKVLEAKSCSSASYDFANFLSDLLKTFFSDLKVEINNELKGLVGDVKVQVKQGINGYVSKQLIPELSTFIESKCGVAPEKQLLSLKPFIMKGLETFLREGKILNKGEIITLARKSIPELITEQAVPNASENTKKRVQKAVTTATNTAFDKGMTTDVITNTLPVAATEILIPEASEMTKKRLQNILKSIQEIVFNSGSPPSAEKLFHTLLEKCGNEAFCLSRDKLMETIDYLIEMSPDDADKIMEFLMKHVLPALSVCFEATAFGLLTVFLRECFERFRKEGTIRGRNLAKPLFMKSATCAMKAANSNMLDKGIGQVSTVVTKKVVTKKVTKTVLEKSVVKNVGGEAFVQTTKRVAVKTSKNVATKVTKDVGSKAVATAGGVTAKQSVKASTRAFKSVSAKATPGGVKVVAKTAQKTSATVTKSLSDGVGNGVKEVQKATLMKSAKTTFTETAEGVTATTTKKVTQKVTQKSVSKTTTQTTSKAAAEVGMKNAAKAGVTAAGISAIVGGVFLYNDLKELNNKKNEGILTLKEYGEQKVERIGEFAGDVIGSGIVGTAVSIAALTGPAGWAAIGAGALVSFATGKVGGYIAKQLAS